MTRVIKEQTFWNLDDYGTASVFEDMELHSCRFSWCVLSWTLDPRLRSTVRNVKLFECSYDDQSLGPAIVEDVLVDNLSAPQGVRTTGTAFKHVVLRGKFGRLILGPLYPIAGKSEDDVKPINDANREYYKHLDWALDISEAEFSECDIRHIPARLIRREPETQAVIRRANVLDGRWKALDLEKTHWQTTIQHMLEVGEDDRVLIASKRAKNFRHLIKGIELLRAEGIADPD